MKPDTLLRIFAGVLAVLGAFVLLQSTLWAFRMQGQIVQSLGGLSGDYAITLSYQGPVVAFHIIGGLLLGVGLFRLLERPVTS